jgi:hypothetical protein
MDTQEANKQETNIEDLTVSEDTAAEVKGSAEGASAGKIKFNEFTIKKTTDS